MVINHNIILDVARPNDRTVIKAKQHDVNSRTVTVSLYNNGEALTVPQDCGVVVNALRPDGQTTGWAGAVLEDGSVLVPLVSWLLEAEGYGSLSVSVISPARERLTSFSFNSYTQKAEWTGAGIEDDPNYDVLLTLISDTEAAKAGAWAAALAAQNAEAAATEAAGAASNAADRAEAAATNASTAATAAQTATAEAHAAIAAVFEMLEQSDAYLHEQVDTAVEAAEDATAAANAAAELAAGKAALADEKAAAAHTAAALADEKAGEATTAAGSANAATALADEKAGVATAAAARATEKTALAEEKAALANAAATLANEKAALAQEKATAADAAALAATAAATAADTAREAIQGDLAAMDGRLDTLEASDAETDKLKIGATGIIPTPIATAQDLTDGGMIRYATGARNSSSVFSYSKYISVEGMSAIVYTRVKTTAASAPSSGIAFYTGNHESDYENEYISGLASSYGAPVPTVIMQHIAVPQGAKYARFTYYSSDAAAFASYPFAVYDAEAYDLSAAERIPEIESDVAQLESDIAELYGLTLNSHALDLDAELTYATNIGASSGTWASGTGRASYISRVPRGTKAITITANDMNASPFALLASQAHVNGTAPEYAAGATRSTVAAGTSETIAVPDDCTYLWILRDYSSVNYAPVSVVFHVDAAIDHIQPPIGLHTMPESAGVLNVIRRARQLTDIRWTPAVDLPRLMYVYRGYPVPDSAGEQYYRGTFRAGVEYIGIPYGRCQAQAAEYGYGTLYVGHTVSPEAFVSAAGNPNSKLCKESAFSLSNHISTPYGAVCSAFACYALGVPFRTTASIPSMPGLTLVGKINDNGTRLDSNKLRLGDLLCEPAVHTAVITDIVRDAAGSVTHVEICDASPNGLADKAYSDGQIGGVCRRKSWTTEQLYTNWGIYSLYRYGPIDAVTYTQSPYVNTGDELDAFRVEHYPVMPYEGNGFVYKTGYVPNNAVRLIISTTDYTHLRVFKDGAELTGSPIQLEAGTDHYDVATITPGEYTAYLCTYSDGNVQYLTAACRWTITE